MLLIAKNYFFKKSKKLPAELLKNKINKIIRNNPTIAFFVLKKNNFG